jgi:type III secretion system FlhB-like substrate exporter
MNIEEIIDMAKRGEVPTEEQSAIIVMSIKEICHYLPCEFSEAMEQYPDYVKYLKK